MKSRPIHNRIWARIAVVLCVSAVAACTAQSTRSRHDERWRINRPDAEQIAAEISEEARERQVRLRELLEQEAPVPSPAVVAPPQFDPLDEILVDLVAEDGELQYVLRALAEQAGLNLIVHPNLIGESYRINVRFQRARASDVFAHLTRIADVYGRIEGDTLIVDPLEEKIFELGFMESSTENNFSAGGDVLGGRGSRGSGSGGMTGGGTGAGSRQIQGQFTYSGTNMPNSNAYDELESMLNILVGQPASGNQVGGITGAGSIEEIGRLSRLDAAIRSDLPTYSLNRATGTLYVRAKPSVIRSVTELIETYDKIMANQILIDAQLVEVKLSDAFRWGIDWSSLRDNMATVFGSGSRVVSGVTGEFGGLTQGARTITIPGGALGGDLTPSLSYNRVNSDVSIALDLMQRYGDVTVLSNPTLRSKHGQAAIISVGTSTTYVSDTRVVATGAGNTAITSQEVQTSQVFDGLMIGVVPFIDRLGNITLSIHPVQSKVDPASLQLVDTGGDTRVTLPVVDLKTMVTQLKVRSGDAVILGGLIDQADFRSEAEVPPIGRVPVIGNLFKQRSNENTLRELVLVLKVTLL